jgi:hypothetical protein
MSDTAAVIADKPTQHVFALWEAGQNDAAIDEGQEGVADAGYKGWKWPIWGDVVQASGRQNTPIRYALEISPTWIDVLNVGNATSRRVDAPIATFASTITRPYYNNYWVPINAPNIDLAQRRAVGQRGQLLTLDPQMISLLAGCAALLEIPWGTESPRDTLEFGIEIREFPEHRIKDEPDTALDVQVYLLPKRTRTTIGILGERTRAMFKTAFGEDIDTNMDQ